MEVEGAVFAGDVGHLAQALLGGDFGAGDAAQIEQARFTHDVVRQDVSAHLVAFGEGELVVDRDRLDRHAVDVEREDADVGVTGAVRNLVLHAFMIGHAGEEVDLGRVVERVGERAVRLEMEYAVGAGDVGHLTDSFTQDVAAAEGTQVQQAVRAGRVVGQHVARNDLVFREGVMIVAGDRLGGYGCYHGADAPLFMLLDVVTKSVIFRDRNRRL